MHYEAIRKGLVVVIRTIDGEFEGRALREESGYWVLEGGYFATKANIVQIKRGRPRD